MTETSCKKSVLITGADGYIGRALVQALSQARNGPRTVVAMDLREVPAERRRQGVTYVACDIRSPQLGEVMKAHGARVVVHLAAVVNPGKKPDRAFLHSVEVEGTANMLRGCLASGAEKLIITSSGAAYGYHADNPAWLDEQDPIRGNPEFAYSDHKRQVEELLAACREEHPELRQLVFRPGTILGARAKNQITDLFDRPYVIGLSSVDSPFVLIWDEDVVGAILAGVDSDRAGIYNLAGDGVLTMKQMAVMMGKPFIPLPLPLVTRALALLKRLGLTQYGPEQVGFLRYRPVLANRRLKEEFGYTPRKTTREVFELFVQGRKHAC